ncbi:transmembrane protein 95 isoform X2 [Fukomys damarensis]|uniref:transmembrane protein 95 isoform X2 n=1 Tax=Fukomys damarensis TaxID=885580 RepID=UPI00053FC30F|nr:transmembrane protein 95 isoform X2 [Fukomys damarensis]
MWILALGGVFLAAAQACIFCRLPAHDLPGRLAQLTSQMEPHWKEWASPDFSAFALDEVTMNKVTEKTHRVLRVMEIKGSISSLPSYWQWLQKTKIPQYIREGGSTTLYNCSTCEGTKASCWPRKRCLPETITSRQKVTCEDADNFPSSSSKECVPTISTSFGGLSHSLIPFPKTQSSRPYNLDVPRPIPASDGLQKSRHPHLESFCPTGPRPI